MATQGISLKAKDTPISERKYPASVQRKHHCYIEPSRDQTCRIVKMDVNYGKLKIHDGFNSKQLSPGSVYFNQPKKNFIINPLKIIAEHCNVEVPEKDYEEKTERFKWIFKTPEGLVDNHYYDNLVGCFFLLLTEGIEMPVQYKRTKRQTADINDMVSGKEGEEDNKQQVEGTFDINAYMKGLGN